MNIHFRLTMLLMLGACSPPEADEPPPPPPSAARSCFSPPPQISKAGVGTLRLGMLEDSARQVCPSARDTVLQLEGQNQPALLIAKGSDTVIAEITDHRLWRLTVMTPGLMTADSLRVGSLIREFARFPDARVAFGEGQFIFAGAHCGLTFEIGGVILYGRAWSRQQIAAAPDSAVVSSILVHGHCF